VWNNIAISEEADVLAPELDRACFCAGGWHGILAQAQCSVTRQVVSAGKANWGLGAGSSHL
jgi:hypothetical protein